MASGLENIETVESPFRRFVTTIGVFPTAFTDAMTYYECLAYLVKYMENTLIPAINENAEAVEELQGLYIQLKAFVDNYFDNLDVQEEINNKLDEMAENGDLTSLIKAALNPDVAWTFDTVADMKTSTNLVDGCFARTLGYHSVGDGGGALYKISDTGTADEMYVIAIGTTLYANLIIQDYITPEVLGAYGDNIHDDTTAVQACLNNTDYLHSVLSKEYAISSGLSVPDYKVVDGGGEIHSSTSCFVIDGKNHITIRDLKLYPQLHGIHLKTDTGHSNYNLFENIFCYGANTAGSKGLFIDTTVNYMNEFTYRNCVFWNFKYGIYATCETTSNPEMAKHTFYDCSSEASTTAGQYIKNGSGFSFYNCRHVEVYSNIWITEGTCNKLLIVGGDVWFNQIANAQFSANTNGQIIGGLRFVGIDVSKPVRNGYIIAGKVVPVEEALQHTRTNIGADTTINYGNQPLIYFNFNADIADTLTLPDEYYGGEGKINEFYVRTAKANNTSTVKIGSITKTLPAGTKMYKFSLNPLEGGVNWFVEEITSAV